MDQTIVMHQPVTLADRGRWALSAIAGLFVAWGLWAALPWVRYPIHRLPPGIPMKAAAVVYALIVVAPAIWAFFRV